MPLVDVGLVHEDQHVCASGHVEQGLVVLHKVLANSPAPFFRHGLDHVVVSVILKAEIF